MRRKPRILMVNEASFLATGYSTYGLEVQSRLHASGRYDIAELACYGFANDTRRAELPWGYFPNMPDPGSEAEYNSDSVNQFGQWTFNDVCLKFKPDIVWDIRDWWMMEHVERSPFRRLFKWCIMPTVDAEPQNEQWIATYINADRVLTYSDWGQGVLQREGGGLINLNGAAPPGADLRTFRPMDRVALRRKFAFDPGLFIVGTVMRNQPRKLYPELIHAFSEFLKVASPEMAHKTYLYLHTTYPDQGWDIPRLIKQSGIGHKILVTYRCRNKGCHLIFPSFFQDARGACPKCGWASAGLPNVSFGVDRDSLAQIINLFDVYVQYANSEGFGMPQVEAASCGVPVFAVDYSAMSDIVRKVEGFPIKVAHYRMDHEFGCYRASLPDEGDFVRKLIGFLSMSSDKRAELGDKARKGVENHYTWEKTTQKWMGVFDNLPLPLHEETWDSPARIHIPQLAPAEFPSNEALVEWAIDNVLGRPDLKNSYMAFRLVRDLNWGVSLLGTGGTYQNENCMIGIKNNLKEFGSNDVLSDLRKICETNNEWERKRCHTHSAS